MDTGSHLLFGATLAGLAMLHPALAHEPGLAQAMLTATMVGSHAPDFDTIARLKGFTAYIRIHRGVTHSLPALFIWPAFISASVAWGFGVWNYVPLLFYWTFASVFLHVFLDWFNAYGVQCFRPFSYKWQHLDILALFEPFLFSLHAAGIMMWICTDVSPGPLFLIIYAVTAAYIAYRAMHHRTVMQRVRRELKLSGVCHVLPGMHWFRWQFVLEAEHYFVTGIATGKQVIVKDVYGKTAASSVVQATMGTDGVRAFLKFAQRVHVSWKEKQDGYLVEWRDVRFWHNHQLPFGVDVLLDRNLNVVSHSLGWRKKMWDPPFV